MRHVLVLVALLMGCSAPTELMLVVKAGPGLKVGTGLDVDSILIQGGPRNGDFIFSKQVDLCTDPGSVSCRPQTFASVDYEGALSLPVRFLFEPGSQGLDEEIHVWIDGYSGTTHTLSSGVHFYFSKGHRLWIEVPLFEACVGKFTCEASDEACSSEEDCVDIMPTPTEPSVDAGIYVGDAAMTTTTGDAAMTTSHDFAIPPDMATCGLPNAVCCPGNTCTTAGYQCMNGVCISPSVTCGQTTQTCCPSDMGTACISPSAVCDSTSNKCVSCGGANEPCCSDGDCNSGFSCQTSSSQLLCEPCGGHMQVCCKGSACALSTDACDSNNMCQVCGGANGPCCTSGVGTTQSDPPLPGNPCPASG